MYKPLHSSLLPLLYYRLSSVVFIQSSYVPDEYWQTLEVAHRMVFDYGYLTWEWKEGIRSYLYPSIFAFFYKILEIFRLDFPLLLIYIPKILQASFTAVSDLYFLKLCDSFGFPCYWANIVLFTNWFWFYCGFRTITNTFETAITIIALYYYPWELFIRNQKGKKTLNKQLQILKRKSKKYLLLASINCIVRPTAVTIWGPLVMFHLFYTQRKNLIDLFLSCILPACVISLLVTFAIDFYWYKRFIIPAFNFLVFNIFKGVSAFYGTHPFYWYFTEGIPVVLGFYYFPFWFGFINLLVKQFSKRHDPYRKIHQIWLVLLTFNVIILSFIPHKEFRFLLPLLPLMMLIIIKISSEFFSTSRKKLQKIWSVFLLIGFIGMSFIFGFLHQRGPLKVVDYFRNSVEDCEPNCFFLFLMPCHSTPLYSHLHVNVTTRFLTCEPPLGEDHYDESEDFFNNPFRWLNSNWDERKRPTHVVFFDSIEHSLSLFLKQKGFFEKQNFLHTIFAKKNFDQNILIYEPGTNK